jgi:hypothetical protein
LVTLPEDWAYDFATAYPDWDDSSRTTARDEAIDYFELAANGHIPLIRNHPNDPEATRH